MSITDDAKALIDGDRQKEYGNTDESFTRIAGLWSAYLGVTVNKFDVAKMMILLKVSRSKYNNHLDSLVDCVGYVECIDRMMHD